MEDKAKFITRTGEQRYLTDQLETMLMAVKDDLPPVEEVLAVDSNAESAIKPVEPLPQIPDAVKAVDVIQLIIQPWNDDGSMIRTVQQATVYLRNGKVITTQGGQDKEDHDGLNVYWYAKAEPGELPANLQIKVGDTIYQQKEAVPTKSKEWLLTMVRTDTFINLPDTNKAAASINVEHVGGIGEWVSNQNS